MPPKKKKAPESASPVVAAPSPPPPSSPISPSREAPSKPGAIEPILRSAEAVFAFLRSSSVPYLAFILKTQLLSLAVTLAGFLLLVLLAFLAVSPPSWEPRALLAHLLGLPAATVAVIALFTTVIGLLLYVIGYAFRATLFLGTWEMAEGRPAPPILPTAKAWLGRSAAYGLLVLGIFAIPFLPSAVLFLIAHPISIGFGVLLLFPAILLAMLSAFLFQFGFWELTLNSRGATGSLRESYRLVRSNLLGVIVFDLSLGAIGFALAMAFTVLRYILAIPLVLLLLLNPVAGLFIGILLNLLVYAALILLNQMLVLPFVCRYWKLISEARP